MDEILFLPLIPMLMALLIVFVASVVQTSSGLGFGMVAAPLLFLIDPVRHGPQESSPIASGDFLEFDVLNLWLFAAGISVVIPEIRSVDLVHAEE